MAKQTLKYVGPSGAGVGVPTIGLVKPGDTFDVDADLADALLAQGGDAAPQFKKSKKKPATNGGGGS